jgi:hypothetical protein
LILRDPAAALTEPQRAVASEVLGLEEAARRHLVIYLSGAHAYGFPSPDSDLDLKAVHTAPTRELLGLSPPPPHASRVAIVHDVEVDYTSNEIGPVLTGILTGNGNYIERFLGDLVLYSTPSLDELRPLIRVALSRRVHRHYRGFATQQRTAFEGADHPTAKKLLYVLRTALTGVHLLRSAEVVTDLRRLLDEYDLARGHHLIDIKRAGERVQLDRQLIDEWRPALDLLFERLDRARAESALPEEPSGAADLDAWLVDHRLRLGSRGD